MHTITCMYFTYMCAHVILMTLLNLLPILCILLCLASCQTARSISSGLLQFFGKWEKGEKAMKQQGLRDSQEKWGAACKREQTHSHAVSSYLPEDLILLLHLPLSQKINPTKKKFLVLQQQQGKPSYPVAKLLLHPTQRKKQKHLIESEREEVGTTISAATHVRGGMKRYPETDASLATQKRLYGFVQW